MSKTDLFFGKARIVQFPAVKAKTSAEADVLVNDSAEAVNDKGGKHFYTFVPA